LYQVVSAWAGASNATGRKSNKQKQTTRIDLTGKDGMSIQNNKNNAGRDAAARELVFRAIQGGYNSSGSEDFPGM
jgi:hypothetical protein